MRLLALLAVASLPSFAQSALLPGAWSSQFFSNTGQPLAGGRIYTCSAGAACPGTPLATYTDASAFSQNSNPIILNSAGRPAVGSQVVGIWLTPGLSYKFVVQNSSGSTIYTVDNITGSSGGSASSNYWTLSGSTISNNNGAGTGDVSMGGSASVATNLSIGQTLKLATSSTQYAILRAANTMVADVTWRWPAADATGCLSSDGAGNLSFATCGGGGGGGTPGGVTSNIQYNNSGTFAGNNNFIWNNGSQRVEITASGSGAAGLTVITGFMQADAGFLAPMASATNYNSIQAPGGGVAAKSITAQKYIQTGNNNGVPTLTTGDTFNAGALYWDTGSMALQVYDGSGWVSLAGGSGSPGGSSTNIQYNSSGSFAGSANFTWNNATRLLSVSSAASGNAGITVNTGFIQADAGFLAPLATATQYNSIQAPGGGMFAKSFTATKYVNSGFGTAAPVATTGDSFNPGALFYNTTSGCEQVYSGTSWSCLGAGGGGTPGGVNTNIQFNNTGAFGGSANFTWNNASRLLTISTTAAAVGIAVGGGYVQADTGFLATGATATQYNSIQAPNGGFSGRSLTAQKYVQSGFNSGIPSVTSGDTFAAGALYWDTSLGVERVFNGSTWQTLATGGVSSVNSLTGALTIQCAAASSCSVGSAGTTITVTAPQPLATTSTPTFGSTTVNGFVASSATGASLAFQAGGGTFQVFGSGAISTSSTLTSQGGVNVTSITNVNSIQTTGGIEACNAGTCSGGSAIRINGTQVATAGGYWIGSVNTPLTNSSVFYTGPTGNFYTRPIVALSTGLSCAGVADGWLAVTTADQYVVVCIGNARYRAQLNAF